MMNGAKVSQKAAKMIRISLLDDIDSNFELVI